MAEKAIFQQKLTFRNRPSVAAINALFAASQKHSYAHAFA
jgi:hypothetical protein